VDRALYPFLFVRPAHSTSRPPCLTSLLPRPSALYKES